VQIDHAVPLADAAKAHELVESKRTTGKVVLVP
jgi:NADPH:quinone reductase-like Zn-dependent oxidoreductase